MRKFYSLATAVLAAGLGVVPAAAQHQFTSTNLDPYSQDFNSLTGSAFTSNTTILGVYAQAEFSGAPFNPGTIGPNDGSNTAANYYHFGDVGSVDRSLGALLLLPPSTESATRASGCATVPA